MFKITWSGGTDVFRDLQSYYFIELSITLAFCNYAILEAMLNLKRWSVASTREYVLHLSWVTNPNKSLCLKTQTSLNIWLIKV
jgi:hypothetical protein